MKLVVTGASGRVGRMLVPALAARGATLLLVGREPARLRDAYPGHAAIGHDDLSGQDLDGATVLHLAAVNNDAGATLDEARAGNVVFLVDTARAAQTAGAARFLNVSSTHALDPAIGTAYAISKREGAEALAEIAGLETRTLYLPAVHGRAFSGRLAGLNRLPAPLARSAFFCLSALKPTVSVERLADAVLMDPPPDDPWILSDPKEENPVYRIATRLLDLAAGLLILVALSWLLVLIGLFIRIGSPGPGIFTQTRVGRHGTPFICFKFRTMEVGTREVGTHDAPANAITGIGRVLRRTKLDELPQAWNLLKGEMALIGPRPCLPVQEKLIEERRRRGVLDMRPGISGLAQVNGIDMSDPVRLARWDARYGALRGLILDLKLLLRTARGGGSGDRVR